MLELLFENSFCIMYKDKKIIVVLPAYNAASTLEMTVHEIPDLVDEIILVDDKSDDATVAVAKRLGLFVFQRAENGGYGANQKIVIAWRLIMGLILW